MSRGDEPSLVDLLGAYMAELDALGFKGSLRAREFRVAHSFTETFPLPGELGDPMSVTTEAELLLKFNGRRPYRWTLDIAGDRGTITDECLNNAVSKILAFARAYQPGQE